MLKETERERELRAIRDEYRQSSRRRPRSEAGREKRKSELKELEEKWRSVER